jgi:uncharacterized membrane protein HdeD (DUF308 family)
MFRNMVRTGNPMLWWMPFLEGVFAVLVGLMFLTAPGAALDLAVVLLGLYWLMSGLLSVTSVFTHPDHPHRWLSLLTGAIGIVAGLVVLGHPTVSTLVVPVSLVVVVGAVGVVLGLLQLIRAIRGEGLTSLLTGGLALVIGLILLARPALSGLALPLIFGVLSVVGGIALFVVAFLLWRRTR